MAPIKWDEVGERYFETGIDRGVLYLNDGRAVAWNGLTSVEDGSDKEVSSYYLDGVKYLSKITPGEFSGKLKAFTYPIQFDQVNGIASDGAGLSYYDQPPQDFSLSYRTRIGNDLVGTEYGYKIHILYNLVADPDPATFDTIGEDVKAIDFTWALTGTPPPLVGHRPTVHVAIDSTLTDDSALKVIEDVLYGTDTTNPRLPSIKELEDLFKAFGILVIVDNGDGTWTAIDQANDYITMLGPDLFQIDNADAVYLDVTTYQISTTYPE